MKKIKNTFASSSRFCSFRFLLKKLSHASSLHLISSHTHAFRINIYIFKLSCAAFRHLISLHISAFGKYRFFQVLHAASLHLISSHTPAFRIFFLKLSRLAFLHLISYSQNRLVRSFVRPSVRPLVTKFQPHGLSARRARRTKSRGPKGLQLEVGARRAPRLLVCL